MIFNRYSTIQSSKKADDLRKSLLGKHVKVHVLDFEVSDHNGELKIIPHAEHDDHIYTLPITRLKISNANNGSVVKLVSKPRRIDIGGPYLIMVFITFMIIAGFLYYIFGEGKYVNTSCILVGSALFIFAILWFRLEMGYFDYIRKIKKWVKDNV